jgi:hypothetical protein
MHDLTLLLAWNECSIMSSNNLQISRTSRHLTFLDPHSFLFFSFFQALPVFLEKLNHVRTIFFPTSLERPSCMTGIEDTKLRVESNYIWSDEMSNTISLSSATRWVQVHVVWWDVKHNIFLFSYALSSSIYESSKLSDPLLLDLE